MLQYNYSKKTFHKFILSVPLLTGALFNFNVCKRIQKMIELNCENNNIYRRCLR
ncbi:Phage protein [Lactococcus lactis subsp. lactis KF147]|nr:Phage protein [Lactococcus lactis subsp. lactis KF147]